MSENNELQTQDRIWVSVEKKISDGDYGNIGVSTGLTRTVPVGETTEDVQKEVANEVLDFFGTLWDIVTDELSKR